MHLERRSCNQPDRDPAMTREAKTGRTPVRICRSIRTKRACSASCGTGEIYGSEVQFLALVPSMVRELVFSRGGAVARAGDRLGSSSRRPWKHRCNVVIPGVESKRRESERETHHLARLACYGKNPQSHRHVALSDPLEAVEMILLANNCGWSKPRQGQLAGTGRRMQRSVPTGNREIPSKL